MNKIIKFRLYYDAIKNLKEKILYFTISTLRMTNNTFILLINKIQSEYLEKIYSFVLTSDIRNRNETRASVTDIEI